MGQTELTEETATMQKVFRLHLQSQVLSDHKVNVARKASTVLQDRVVQQE
jgi:hypothetical protein